MPKLSDYLKSINETKVNLMRKTSDELEDDFTDIQQNIKDYPAFVVNRCLSYHQDTILFANELNMLGYIDNIRHFEFLLHTIRQKKRFSSWSKPETLTDSQLALKKLYGYNDDKAVQSDKLLSEEQKLKLIKMSGINNDKQKQ